jgi:FtsZ-binding cell division protein ZapB
MATQKVIKSNNETFTQKTFNGVSILVRDVDEYVNASKMGGPRDVRDFLSGKKFSEICSVWGSRKGRSKVSISQKPAKYPLLTGLDGNTQGTYNHPDQVHFVAEWVDLEYAFTVRDIMESIDQQLHSIMEDNDLPDEPVVAKRLLDSATVELKVKDAEIEELKEDYERLEQEFYDLALEIFHNGQRRGKLKEKWNDWKGNNSIGMCGQISVPGELRS